MVQSEAECKYDWLPFYISKAPQNFIVSNLLLFKLKGHRNSFLWAGIFVSKYRKSTKNKTKQKTSKHCSFVFQRACVFNIFFFCSFFSAFTKNFFSICFFFASFVNPKQRALWWFTSWYRGRLSEWRTDPTRPGLSRWGPSVSAGAAAAACLRADCSTTHVRSAPGTLWEHPEHWEKAKEEGVNNISKIQFSQFHLFQCYHINKRREVLPIKCIFFP